MLASVCVGAGIAFVYDCLRIFRRVIVHGSFWISMEDLFYWIFVSAVVFTLLYYENNGAFRWFAILGAAAGMAVYRWIWGRFWVEYMSRFWLWVKKLCCRGLAWLFIPWRRLGNFTQKQAASGMRRLERGSRYLKKRLTLQLRLIKIELGKGHSRKTGGKVHGQKKNCYQKEKTE